VVYSHLYSCTPRMGRRDQRGGNPSRGFVSLSIAAAAVIGYPISVASL
jgi:hypothetical protein